MTTPHIILIMQEENFEPIDWLDELCVCNELGELMVFPNLESADAYKEEHSIDGRIVPVPIY